MMQCPRCAAALEGEPAVCPWCGAPTDVSADSVRDRLVRCPVCGAANAISRERCGRCHREMTGEIAVASISAASPPAPGVEDHPRIGFADRILAGLAVLAGCVVVGVLVTVASAFGIGPLVEAAPAPSPADPVALELAGAEASSSADGLPAVNVLDADTSTAWVAGSDDDREHLEVTLSEPGEVVRILVWNGFQDGQAFDEHGRIGALEITAGDRTFTVEALGDTTGPQAIQLPEAVVAERVRLTVTEVVPGEDVAAPAVSRIQVDGPSGRTDEPAGVIPAGS